VTETFLTFFHRPADESAEAFGKRLRHSAGDMAAENGAATVIVLVDDGEVGAPPEATAMPSTFDGVILSEGIEAGSLPVGDAVYRVSRRVIKRRRRGAAGDRSPGFTVVCPSVRASFLDHDQFNAHWLDNHSRVHVAASPGTCHYEQLIIDDTLTPGAPAWDGVGLLSFAAASEYTDRLFGGPEDQQAIMDDVARFLDLPKGETLPASEYVYRDELA
jgi:EthD domain